MRIIVNKEWNESIVGIKKVGEQIIPEICSGKDTFKVISAYTPHVGRN